MGLTTLGIVHTVVGIVAVVAAFWLLARDKEISGASGLGKLYIVTTAFTAASALGIFQHGGFGPAHTLAVLTLAGLALGMAAERRLLGGASRYISTVSFSATVLFSMIPTVTEALTRLPPGAPVAASPEAPIFQSLYGGLLVLFLVGVALQVVRLRRTAAA